MHAPIKTYIYIKAELKNILEIEKNRQNNEYWHKIQLV